jgi:hypothetical protein
MDKYFYFISQLPFLKFQEKPPISREDFLSQAVKWLSPKNFKALSRVAIDNFEFNDGDSHLTKKYKIFEAELRQAIVSLRSGASASGTGRIAGEVKSAAGGNPLEREINIFRLRWKFIEEQQAGHIFDLGCLELYFLKLQILETLSEFDKEKGTAVFDRLCGADSALFKNK